MAHLAAGLANAGIEVTVITDAPCAKAVWAVVDALPVPVNLEIASIAESSVHRLRKHLETGDRPMTHLVAIERVSPGSDGKPHREHGWDMSRETAPLHLLFDAKAKVPWYTIGIGDGGNEIGMGSLPKEIIETEIPNGQLIAATTAVDSLIVAGVSNSAAMVCSPRPPASSRSCAARSCIISTARWTIAICRPRSKPGRPSMTAVSTIPDGRK